MSIQTKLSEIERKITLLGNENHRLKTENNRMQIEAELLKKRLAEQQKTIDELENKNVHLHISRSGSENSDSSDKLKKKIDQYIREIDKCIELLNS